MRRAILIFPIVAGLAFPGNAVAGERDVGLNGLAASYATPDADPSGKGIVLIAGSGPTDRNGNSRLGVTADYLKQLSDALVGDGISVLRYDKRGVGASKSALSSESALRFGDFVADAAAWAAWVRARDGIACVFVLGHSQGGLVATLIAEQMTLAGLILLASPGRPLAQVLEDQLTRAPLDAKLRSSALSTLKKLEQGKTDADTSPDLQRLFRPSVQPFLISLINIDPAQKLAQLSLPTLIVSGGHDLQVGKADYDALRAANPGATAVRIADMNHVLKDAPAARKPNLATYSDPNLPLSAQLKRAVTSFVTGTPCPAS